MNKLWCATKRVALFRNWQALLATLCKVSMLPKQRHPWAAQHPPHISQRLETRGVGGAIQGLARTWVPDGQRWRLSEEQS
jgi:hypothetical protein